jgi:hypothetical protein
MFVEITEMRVFPAHNAVDTDIAQRYVRVMNNCSQPMFFVKDLQPQLPLQGVRA